MTSFDEELQVLDHKLKQLRIDYEHYFLGRHPREPSNLRAEVQKQFIRHSSSPIRNTASRFRFNSLNSRFQALKRQWDLTLRQIEAGTYKRHVFKANLRGPAVSTAAKSEVEAPPEKLATLFESYKEAARACGQNVESLTPDKLQAAIRRQEAALKDRLGCENVDFRVVVTDGKVKLKASARRD
ncbi:MAG TPA: hypothetical protein EYQ54_17580 [Myxococcales bacterium]|nr:hypothetical protein [Myxococcales bacterium]HIL01077.1 hypothetical protein [Myxococcales bacterium]